MFKTKEEVTVVNPNFKKVIDIICIRCWYIKVSVIYIYIYMLEINIKISVIYIGDK